ncbi:MAG: sialidase family protein [Oscillospiraceae bacterium]|nr:sialidase family protein [Oscillospiraceae bacterium]
MLRDGSWLHFNYSQLDDRYCCSISSDQGRSFRRFEGSRKLPTQFDEPMAYERLDGSIRMLARTSEGELAESLSRDGGRTWSEARLSGIANPGSRFFISRTPSGRVLLINNDCRTGRTHMTVSLSEDDGVTWTCRKLIDNRNWVSYPDADFYGGRIYMTYDRDRLGAKEILFLSFREEDIMDDEKPLCPQTVSRPDGGGSGS